MEQLHYVTNAVPCGRQKIQVEFDTGEKGIFDCSYLTADPYWRRLKEEKFFNSKVIRNFEEFKTVSDVIVANRWEEALEDVKDKVFTRDLFTRD